MKARNTTAPSLKDMRFGWLSAIRDHDKADSAWRRNGQASVCAQNAVLSKLRLREELRGLWTRTTCLPPDQLVIDLQACARSAEDSGTAVSQEFALKLRAAHARKVSHLMPI
jgi:stearoyl-CoA desaturase (delta-9 desaturase)